MDVATFLSRYPPFDALAPDELARVAKAVEIEHFPAGAVILEQSGAPARYLYVVRKGAVELIAEGRLYDLLSDGEVFGQFSLLAEESPTSTVRAHEDTLCYLIGADVADEILGTSAGQSFVLGKMRARLTAGHEAMEPPGLPFRPIGGLVRRAPVAADSGMTVAAAAERMAAEHVSCLLVPMRQGWGIVTDRDLRSRVLASHRSPETPVEDVATFPVKTLPEHALAGEALVAMFAEGVHHFPVTGPDGTIDGVVTATDLMDIGRDTPFSIRGQIERARTRDEVAAAGRRTPSRRPGARRRQLRAGERRPRRGARRRRHDHAAAHARDRTVRRASGAVGVARARERRAAGAGPRHRSGSRARVRRAGGVGRGASTHRWPSSRST